jgi:hypothetical protein
MFSQARLVTVLTLLTLRTLLQAETQGDTDRTIAAWLKRRQKRSDVIIATKVWS